MRNLYPSKEVLAADHVYFLTSYGYAWRGYFKVGVSKNPDKRMKQINSNAPILNMCLVFAVKTPRAYELEQAIIRYFFRERCAGEWFCVDWPRGNILVRDERYAIAQLSKKIEARAREFASKWLQKNEGEFINRCVV